MKYLSLLAILIAYSASAGTYAVKGFSLTETWKYSTSGTHVVDPYDAELDPALPKTAAQRIVDQLSSLGVKRINLSPQASMRDPRQSFLTQNSLPGPELRKEKARILRLIKYIHGKGMSVGIRPIFFVLAKDGSPNFVEVVNGQEFKWWHGNIQPNDPNLWFESYRSYLKSYYPLAQEAGVEEFTIGAELYSMTVGIEDQWKRYPHGFPGEWLKILGEAKANLPSHVRVMYDINFTDERTDSQSLAQFGGEFARWFYRLAGFAHPDPDLVKFWNGLDAIGIDMYRSLATDAEAANLPTNYDDLVALLQHRSDLYAQQIDQNLEKIGDKLGTGFKDVVLKEIGYASRDLGFIRPFEYIKTKNGPANALHQAAAYEAIFRSFWKPGFEWMRGIVFWDASVNEGLHGPSDHGFSPLGKTKTEQVLKTNW